MKNLGKQTLRVRSFLDGVLADERDMSRVIYQKPDGTFWINWLHGSKRQVGQLANGSFLHEAHARSLKVSTFDEVVAGIKARLRSEA